MPLTRPCILSVTNNSSHIIDLATTDTGYGTPILLAPGMSGNPDAMYIPNWTWGQDYYKNHHLTLTSWSGKNTWVIWHNAGGIFAFNNPTAADPASDSSGVQLYGSDNSYCFILTVNSDLSLTLTKVDIDSASSKFKDLSNAHAGAINTVGQAMKGFYNSGDYTPTHNALKGVSSSYQGSNITKDLLAGPFGGMDMSALADFPTITFSAGVDIAVFVGYAGAIGIASNIVSGNAAIVQSAGMTVGLDIDLTAGIQMGLWLAEPADLAGVSYGFTVGIDIEIGFNLGFYWNASGDLYGMTIGVDTGIDADAGAFYIGQSWAQPF